jgi:hypothetical protein
MPRLRFVSRGMTAFALRFGRNDGLLRFAPGGMTHENGGFQKGRDCGCYRHQSVDTIGVSEQGCSNRCSLVARREFPFLAETFERASVFVLLPLHDSQELSPIRQMDWSKL